MGCILTRGVYRGVRQIRLWSDFPRGGRGDAVYASLTLAYIKSMVLFLTCLTVHELMEASQS